MPVELLTDEQGSRLRAIRRTSHPNPAGAVLLPERHRPRARRAAPARPQPPWLRGSVGDGEVLGRVPRFPTEVPPEVAEYVAAQLGIADPACLNLYGQREPTHREHAGEIQRVYGYRDFSEASAGLRDFLAARAWTSNDGPRALFDRATAWLVEHKVLLPGATTLARLVAAVRTDGSERLWDQIADGVDLDLRGRLNALLEVEAGSRFSVLERLRTSPAKLTGSELERALKRVAEVRRLGGRPDTRCEKRMWFDFPRSASSI